MDRPEGRKKYVTGGGKGVSKKGEGLGSGQLGSSRPQGSGSSGRSSGQRSSGGGGILKYIILIVILLAGGGGGLSSFLGSSDSADDISDSGSNYNNSSDYNQSGSSQSSGNADLTVASGSRDKRTVIKGNGKDVVTIMVYMCGTDLESKYGMASSDLSEMMKAKVDSDKVNIVVYTGGCKNWKNSSISTSRNQIFQIKDNKLVCLEDNCGTSAMTDPKTLTSFIKYCAENFPANRNELIFWDHGGGSVSGYGYDEKNPGSGSMGLAKIDEALKNSGVTFDFIGFDACLMATLETGFMLSDYADYMIASEETEPGIGWYYTDWLTELSKNTSSSTVEIGKNIADGFVTECAKSCKGQKTTLSVTDLAELSNTVPDKFRNFSSSISNLIENNEYKQVSDARYSTREFAASSKIDQVDLIDLANNLGTNEAKDLVKALEGAVKYNRTSSNMTRAYGLSIYFPYRKVKNVDSAVSAYNKIGMDSEYSRCIKQFASLETTGQSQSSSQSSGSLLGNLIGQAISNGSGIDLSQLSFLAEGLLDNRSMADYIDANHFDASNLTWSVEGGKHILKLSEEQWSLVHDLALNVFYDDGYGYIDMGLDNTFEFDEAGNLIGDTDGTWLSVNSQPVAYYYDETTKTSDDTIITGHIPAKLNGDLVNLLVVFDNEHPHGYIAGARADYDNGETDTTAKAISEINKGDVIQFLCDYYDYNGQYEDSYALGDAITVGDSLSLSNTKINDSSLSVMYRFTDIYNQEYWTEAIIENN